MLLEDKKNALVERVASRPVALLLTGGPVGAITYYPQLQVILNLPEDWYRVVGSGSDGLPVYAVELWISEAPTNLKLPTAPEITAVTPAASGAGFPVVIAGVNFVGVVSVTFSGVATSFTVKSTTQIAVTVPFGAVSGVVKVVTQGGSASYAGFIVKQLTMATISNEYRNWTFDGAGVSVQSPLVVGTFSYLCVVGTEVWAATVNNPALNPLSNHPAFEYVTILNFAGEQIGSIKVGPDNTWGVSCICVVGTEVWVLYRKNSASKIARYNLNRVLVATIEVSATADYPLMLVVDSEVFVIQISSNPAVVNRYTFGGLSAGSNYAIGSPGNSRIASVSRVNAGLYCTVPSVGFSVPGQVLKVNLVGGFVSQLTTNSTIRHAGPQNIVITGPGEVAVWQSTGPPFYVGIMIMSADLSTVIRTVSLPETGSHNSIGGLARLGPLLVNA